MGILQGAPKAGADSMVTAIRRYQTARSNIILLVAFTLINAILLLVGSNTYFLFSAAVPYFLLDFGMTLCGMYPPEYYEGFMTEAEFLGGGFFAVMAVIALIILAFYAFFYFRSQKVRVGIMTATLVFFAIDTLLMIYLYGLLDGMLLDFAFHAYIIVAQILGIRAAAFLKKAEAEGTFDGKFGFFQTAYVPPVNTAETTEDAPAETTEDAPAETTEDAPAETTEDAPAETTESVDARPQESPTDEVPH